ncbi:MAG TPA: PAS domain S-box protein, partial [Candidatus Caenarcaniphilales bacterium]
MQRNLNPQDSRSSRYRWPADDFSPAPPGWHLLVGQLPVWWIRSGNSSNRAARRHTTRESAEIPQGNNLRPKAPIQRKVGLGFGLLSLISIVLSLESARTTNQLLESTRTVNHTYQKLEQLELVLSDLKDGETGERGYILTGEEPYLAPYKAARLGIDQEIQVLRGLTAGDPGQQERVKALELLTKDRLRRLKEGIDLRRQLGSAGAFPTNWFLEGKQIMDNIRALIQQMKQVEEMNLTQQLNSTKVAARRTSLSAFIGTTADLVILLIVYGLISHEIKQRRKAEAERLQLGAIVDSSEDAIFGESLEGTITSWNSSAQQLYGYTAAEVKGQPVSMLMLPNSTTNASRVLEQVKRGERIEPYETVQVCKDNRLLDVALAISPIRNLEGEIIGASNIARDITERKRLEAALYRERELLRAVLDNVEAGIVACDAQGGLTFFNRAARLFHGLSADATEKSDPSKQKDLTSLTSNQLAQVYDLYHSDTKTPMALEDIPLARALREERVRNQEMVIVPKQGKSRFLLASGQAIFDSHGKKLGAVVAMHDITELRQAEEAIRSSEARFQAFMNNTPTIAFIKTKEGRYDYINKTFEQFYNTQLNQVRGKTDFELWPRQYAEQLRANDLEALDKEEAKEVVEIIPAPDGCPHYWLVFKFAITDTGEYIGGVAVDITERIKAEEALLLRDRAIEAASDGILIAGPPEMDNPIIYANPAFERITGYARSDFIGRNCRFLQGIDTDREEVARIRASIETNTGCQVTLLNYRKDGTPFWNELTLTPAGNVAGGTVNFVGVARDVTERKHVEEELKALTRQLAKSNQELSDFARVASHDLQEPLRKIQAFSDRLKTKNLVASEGQPYLERMQSAAARMSSLITDLLALSRVTTKVQPFVPIDLTKLAQEVVSDLEIRIEEVKGKVELGALPVIEADP